jgi:hypothetical protein
MIVFGCVLWDANEGSFDFSRMYDESWVEKLYRGVMRNTKRDDVAFIVWVDRIRQFNEPGILQGLLRNDRPYGYNTSCIEPYGLGMPMILAGLDTVIVGDLDPLFEYCVSKAQIALPRDPYNPQTLCNGVSLVPAGQSHVYIDHKGENDMDWMRQQNPAVIDDMFPNAVVSYKGHIKPKGSTLSQANKIVYFHGLEKPHELGHLSWVTENWR